MGLAAFLPPKMARTPFTILPKARERVVRLPYLGLAALQFLDIALTYFILLSWAERAEGNPFARMILEHFGLVIGCSLFLAFKWLAVVVFYIAQFPIRLASAVYTLVVINNLLFLVLWAHLVLTS